MQTEKNIFIAFILNLSFSILEFMGGIYTGSVAIVSDAIHDIGDAVSIGVSFFLEKKSKKQPDDNYTYGYARFSVVGSFVTTIILLLSSMVVIHNALGKIVTPIEIKYNGMIALAMLGMIVNLGAAFITRKGHSLNQKAVNLHMLEDVLGWIVVLIGAIVIKISGFVFIDPIMSICVAMFILINALKNLKEIIEIFLEKTPHNIDVANVKEHIVNIDGIMDVHHIHIWTLDGHSNYATMHVVTNDELSIIKKKIREELKGYNICHITIESEKEGEYCSQKICKVEDVDKMYRCHHNHCH